jgi:hypothetical protein
MDKNSFMPQRFLVKPGNLKTSSAVSGLNGRSCLIRFDREFSENIVYNLYLSDIVDADRTPLNAEYEQVRFQYSQPGEPPYIQEWRYLSTNRIELIFNTAMDTTTVLNLDNYRITPSGHVERIGLLDPRMNRFVIDLSNDTYFAASGVTTYIELSNIKNLSGQKFLSGNILHLTHAPLGVDDIFVYPQPVPGGNQTIGFANVAASTRIDIFNLSGQKIITLQATGSNGGMIWNMLDFNDQRIPAGVYFYHARWENQTKTGKFTVLR